MYDWIRPVLTGVAPQIPIARARVLSLLLYVLNGYWDPRGEMVVLLRAFTHLDAYEDSLERAGHRVPEDVSVVGFDDVPLVIHRHEDA